LGLRGPARPDENAAIESPEFDTESPSVDAIAAISRRHTG